MKRILTLLLCIKAKNYAKPCKYILQKIKNDINPFNDLKKITNFTNECYCFLYEQTNKKCFNCNIIAALTTFHSCINCDKYNSSPIFYKNKIWCWKCFEMNFKYKSSIICVFSGKNSGFYSFENIYKRICEKCFTKVDIIHICGICLYSICSICFDELIIIGKKRCNHAFSNFSRKILKID